MTPELLIELSRLPLFPRTAATLCQVAGLEATARLIAAWGGQEWPVPVHANAINGQGARRYAHLCEVAGERAAERIVAAWGGSRLQIPNLKEVLWLRTQERMRAEFDTLTTSGGYSSPEAVFHLGIKYGVTGRAVEKTLKRAQPELSDAIDQGELF